MARYTNPVPQYLDGSGDPIVNGKLTFYKSGTTSPLITYADNLLSTPNTNPVLLDAAGRAPNIFFDGAARVVCTYDDLLTGELGKQLFDKDPVSGESGFEPFGLWDAQIIYGQFDIVRGSDGEFYQSLSNDNQGNDPTLTATKWKQVNFIDVWNTNVSYSVGDIVQTTDGNLWKSVQAQSGNNPIVDDGTNWKPAVNTDNILAPTNTVVVLTGGGSVVANRVNEVQDAGTYNIPLANTVSENQYLIVSQPMEFVTFQPTVQTSGSDVITINGSTDTSILFDNSTSREIRLTSNGVDEWRLTV